MEYIKFEKIIEGENPIIRVSYINWLGKIIVRDICHGPMGLNWHWMDNDSLVYWNYPIDTFYKSDLKEYYVNGKNNNYGKV